MQSKRHEPVYRAQNHSLPQLQSALTAAKEHPVLVDFWARWCMECQRMDVETYDNPRVEKALQPLTLIRVNVTASDAASRNMWQCWIDAWYGVSRGTADDAP
ncbi:thioredoxin family protein [Acidithiobacillus ferrianus]|uniref:thioredoxin family protein n=1 Tax=Acidithiobacillus ferrianus TaxID=2678518 RepID=UPI0034E3D9F9